MVLLRVVSGYASVLRLGEVHGDICVLQQLADIHSVVRGHDKPDTRLDRQWETAHLDLVLDDDAQTPQCFFGIRDIAQDDAELVAAEPGDDVLRAMLSAKR